jgi:hypothetical protein
LTTFTHGALLPQNNHLNFLLALAYRAPQHKGQAEESLKIFGIPYSHFFVNGSKNGRDTFKLLNSQPDLKGHVPFALGNSKEERGVNSIWNGYSIFNNDVLDLERDELTPDPFYPAYPGFFGTYSLKPQLTLKEALTILEQEHFRQ